MSGLAFYFVLSARADDLVPPILMAWAGTVRDQQRDVLTRTTTSAC